MSSATSDQPNHAMTCLYSDQVPKQTMLWLIALQNVFSHQLPRMPKEYITRWGNLMIIFTG